MIVEPCEGFSERYPLVMASTIVDINSSPTQKVRVLNPSSDPVSVYQDSVIGTAEQYEDVSILVQSEDPSQSENHSAVRRIQLMSQDTENSVPHAAVDTSKSK